MSRISQNEGESSVAIDLGITSLYRSYRASNGQRVGKPACMSRSASIMPEHRSWWSTWPPRKASASLVVFGLMQRTKCELVACRFVCSCASWLTNLAEIELNRICEPPPFPFLGGAAAPSPSPDAASTSRTNGASAAWRSSSRSPWSELLFFCRKPDAW